MRYTEWLISSAFVLVTSISMANTEVGATCATPVNENSILAPLMEQNFAPSCVGTYYNWGRGQNGWGYCYEWTCNGYPLNNGLPVANYLCESRSPSRYDWGRGMDGWGYCYQWTPQGIAMNEGQPVTNWNCERTRPSYYSWGRGMDGNAYCYQYTAYGVAMNAGQPVSPYLCRR